MAPVSWWRPDNSIGVPIDLRAGLWVLPTALFLRPADDNPVSPVVVQVRTITSYASLGILARTFWPRRLICLNGKTDEDDQQHNCRIRRIEEPL
jgi:hypothetical protein